MSVIAGLGTFGVAAILITLLILGTGKNAGSGRAPALGWGAVFFLSLLAGSALAAAGDPLKFRGLVQDLLSFLNEIGAEAGGGTITMAGLAVLLLVIIFYKKLTTRAVACLVILFSFTAGSTNGTLAILTNIFTSIVNRIA